jgi:hypothetical protein
VQPLKAGGSATICVSLTAGELEDEKGGRDSVVNVKIDYSMLAHIAKAQSN